MLRTAIGVMCVVLSSACAGGTSTTVAAASQSAAPLRQECHAVDSSFALGAPVYRECGVDRQARERGRPPRPDFEPRPPFKECYNAVVAVVVDERGSTLPATARVVRTNDAQFAQAILNTIPAWRFSPAQKNGMPVKQVVEIGMEVMTRVTRADRPMNPPLPTRPQC